MHCSTQCLDHFGIPGRIGTGPDLSHPLCAAQLLELQRLVLHRQLMAAFALAVKPLEDLRGEAECAAAGRGNPAAMRRSSLGARTL
jgi:hypothetical protein